MEAEIEDQILDLPAFASGLEQVTAGQPSEVSDLVFTGAGDSYASSLFAFYLSNGEALAADPYELSQRPRLCKDKIVFITSLSGRTRANIRLARQLKRIARRRVAITAEPTSQLAEECDDVIRLPYSNRGTITPGTLSFTLSLLAVASRIKSLPVLRDMKAIDQRARNWAKQSKIFSNASFLFIGSGIGYALSAYGTFKIHELLGQSADYEHTEQVGHSRLFSVRNKDNVICLCPSWDKKTSEVARTLDENGFNSNPLTGHSEDPVIAGLETSFSLQHLALRLAKRSGLREAAFLTDKKRLALSNRLIY